MPSLSYNRIRLNLECAWNLGGKTTEVYSNFFVLSGAAPLLDAEVEPTALDLFDPIRQLADGRAQLIGWSYYPPNSHPATVVKTYAAGTHPCDGSAFVPPHESQQSEVCILCEGPTDKNSRGKQVYLRKWIHSVQSAVGVGNSHPTLAAGDPLLKWKNGSGPKLLVPIDSDSGVQASTWTINQHLYTHQFRKGKKRKVVTKTEYVPIPIP